MQVLNSPGDLVDDVLLVFVLENIFSDDMMKVDVHKLEHQVDILFVISLDDVDEFDDVLMVEFLEEHYLPVGTLCICGVLERIEDFFQSVYLVCTSIEHLPNMSVCSASNLPLNLVPTEHMRLDVFSHAGYNF